MHQLMAHWNAQGLLRTEEAEERLCVICLVNDRDTTVLPCRHMCMCHECAQAGCPPSCGSLIACGSMHGS